ncbi:MAG: hypothetical protein P4L40_00720 [Terracidiphilus sp.]|nr:hypothetical protein [Terracidiphilus sp.]
MRSLYLASIAGLLFLDACNSTKKPSDANFTNAINQYLVKHGEACTVLNREFPLDVPKREQKEQYGIGPKLAVLEQTGLLRASDTAAVVHGMQDALQGPTPPQPVRHYELTAEGGKYFQELSGGFGQTTSLCYGRKQVDSIVKWTEPMTMGAYSQTEVTYTYKIADLAAWAERPEIQHTFSDIQAEIAGQSKAAQIAGLRLTNKGWEVPAQ